MNFMEINAVDQMPIKYIYVKGDREQRGYQYGLQAKASIHKSIQAYKDIIRIMRGDEISWDEMIREATAFIPALRRYDREYFAEMKFIAKGADIPLEEIVFLNVRSEIMNPAWSNKLIPEGCTSFLIQPQATKNHNYYIGQTYDWFPICFEQLILLHSEDEIGHEFITITEAGMIAKIGVNNSGVGILLNYLNNFEVNRKGTPYNVLLRRALDSKSSFEAQRNIIKSPIAYGLNIMIADQKGFGVTYELAANGIDFFYPTDGILVHTNHHLSEKLSIRTFNKKMYPTSIHRLNTSVNLLKKHKIGVEDIWSVLAYHDKNDNNNICRHANSDEYNIDTIFAIVFELTNMEMHLCLHTPCNSNIYKIALNKVFHTCF